MKVALSCCSALFADELVRIEGDVPGRALYFGRVTEPLPEIADPEFNFRSCQLLAWAVEDLRPQQEAAFARYGSERVAIVLGASNTGVDEAENNIDQALDRSAEAPAPFPQITLEEVKKFLKPQPIISSIQKGSIVELVSGPFKGEKSKVVRLDESREEVVLELIEAAVPIPVTVKADQIRIIKKEAD